MKSMFYSTNRQKKLHSVIVKARSQIPVYGQTGQALGGGAGHGILQAKS